MAFSANNASIKNDDLYLYPESNNGRGKRFLTTALPSALPPVILALAFPLLFAGCLSTQALAMAVTASLVAVFAFGTLYASRTMRNYGGIAASALAVICLIVILTIPESRASLFSFLNTLIYQYDDRFEAYVPLISSGSSVAGSPVFAAALGVLNGLLSFALTRLGKSAVTLAAVLIISSVATLLNTGYAVMGCTAGIAGWVCHARLVQLYRASYSSLTYVIEACFSAIIASAVAIACGGFYTPQALIDQVHESLHSAVFEARYGSDTLPEGDLSAAYSMNDGSEDRITVSFDQTILDDLLLRGFVGGTFENGTWKALDHTAYEGEWSGAMAWLADEGLAPSRQRAAYDDERTTAGKEPVKTVNVTIDAANANSRYVYVPYTLRELSGTNANKNLDGSIISGYFGDRSYSYSIDNIASGDVLEQTKWLSNADDAYTKAEAVLSAFAKENYTLISDDDKQVINDLIFNEKTWDKSAAKSKYAVISRVRTMLSTLASYSEDVNAPSGNEPFIKWFLSEERNGNSSYFATAAALAFRAQGIPARYVEGYRASSQELAEAGAENNATLNLTSKNAHAWVEVYIDGLGWTPVEVTPGFYTQKIKADSVISVREAVSNGKGSDVLQTESVAGDVNKDEDANDPNSVPLGSIVFHTGLSIILVFVLLIVFAALERRIRLARRAEAIASDDQSISVPALYSYLALILTESDMDFDTTKPLDSIDKFDAMFKDIDSKEYQRVIEIHQAYAFGARKLKPNEMRTLRRFVERLHSALPEPMTFSARIKRRFVRVL